MLPVYQLRFRGEVTRTIELDDRCGAALRGMIFETVWKQHCENQRATTCVGCPRLSVCPVSAFISPLRSDRPRGRDIPRPYVMYPPLERAQRYEPGQILQFGMSLFGKIIQHFPYIALSVLQELELGRKHSGQRGRVLVRQIEAYNSITGERSTVYEAGRSRVVTPSLTVTPADITARAATFPTDMITLQFLTPTRIFDQDVADPHASFKAIIKRLYERFSSLQAEYGTVEDGQPLIAYSKEQLANLADHVVCQHDQRRWEELSSYSNRTKQKSNISGFVGPVTFVGDLSHFRELLAWGEIIRVGKEAVKGNGWYKVLQY